MISRPYGTSIFIAENPAMNRWAIYGRPYGTGGLIHNLSLKLAPLGPPRAPDIATNYLFFGFCVKIEVRPYTRQKNNCE